ncbi:hypothetical protein ACMFMG_008096 [Clarireedia jacksonii]
MLFSKEENSLVDVMPDQTSLMRKPRKPRKPETSGPLQQSTLVRAYIKYPTSILNAVRFGTPSNAKIWRRRSFVLRCQYHKRERGSIQHWDLPSKLNRYSPIKQTLKPSAPVLGASSLKLPLPNITPEKHNGDALEMDVNRCLKWLDAW